MNYQLMQMQMQQSVALNAGMLQDRTWNPLDPAHFAEWAEYLDRSGAAQSTVQAYKREIKSLSVYLEECGEWRPTVEDLEAWKTVQIESGLKPNTVNNHISCCKQFFKWTARRGLYPDIAQEVKKLKTGDGYEKGYLTARQAGKLCGSIDRESVRGKRDYAMVRLMLTTGLRTIEVARANREDLRVRGECLVLYVQGKGRADRREYVKISEGTEDALLDYLKARGGVKPSDPLFAAVANRCPGGRMTTRSISRIAKDALKAIGLDSVDLTAHSLRHTAAMLSLEAEDASLEKTQQLLRHKSPTTTKIYTHMRERDKNNLEYQIDSAIFG